MRFQDCSRIGALPNEIRQPKCRGYRLNRGLSMLCNLCMAIALTTEYLAEMCWGQNPDKKEGMETVTNSVGMKLVLIPKGTFMMGSPATELGRATFGDDREETQHPVTISQDFYLGVTEVTQSQYSKVMGVNPSRFQGKDASWRLGKRGEPVDTSNYPVEFVEWGDAVEFCKRLSELPEEKAAGRHYRLPTEAEWEYSCRAGSETAYSFGDNVEFLDQHAWFTSDPDASEQRIAEREVARLKPNRWGLYDMHGSVEEWCADWVGPVSTDAVTDPSGPFEGEDRVVRGGSHGHEARHCRSARRSGFFPSFASPLCGFRVAMLEQPKPKE